MLIRFNEISPQGSHYTLEEVQGLASQTDDFSVSGPLAAWCTLKRKGEDKVEMQGRLQVGLVLTCDRCLSEYPIAVDTEFQLLFVVEQAGAWQVRELDICQPDLDTVMLDEPIIDLDDVLRQQVYLALPMKQLCSEQCRGICPQCGVNLNQMSCDCAEQGKDSPFAALAKTKRH